ncbi:MAG: patatin-like phospholipase family protein [Candidatus Gracilibacteria bacterium]|nr:patatin-like phospholipase family protein [Candidatus Gracilibacteria bacterium]MDD3120562.1 patatin-like phospholipase family protein [Candidatus Gracilibacteria bacterium]MDD4530121.1 patatin-like phospholipase family protein [Candidatus Gracilibacteria bacterium]
MSLFDFVFGTRKKLEFSLALGGGSARGIAHIGVFKFLEEKNLVPSEISGTSMGSIIGSAIAFSKTSEDLEKILKEMNYLNLVDLDLKTGLIAGKKILDFLEKMFGNVLIEEAKIPLKIVAVDLNSGEKIVFKSGRLIDAIRSSISIPGVIAPYSLNNKMFIDGGVVNNLPIEVLDSKNIIAVSVLRNIDRPISTEMKIFGINFNKNLFGTGPQIIQKTLDLMMEQNEKRSLESKKNIILIYPNFPEVDYYEFNKYKEIIEIGYLEAKKVLVSSKISHDFIK